jgi:hypothetical protein
LICEGETKRSGTAVPFIVTETLFNVDGKGVPGELAVEDANPTPKIAVRLPATIGPAI